MRKVNLSSTFLGGIAALVGETPMGKVRGTIMVNDPLPIWNIRFHHPEKDTIFLDYFLYRDTLEKSAVLSWALEIARNMDMVLNAVLSIPKQTNSEGFHLLGWYTIPEE